MTDQPTLRDRIDRGGPVEYYCDNCEHAFVAPTNTESCTCSCGNRAWQEKSADRAAEELRYWKSKLAAVTDGRDALQQENARLRKNLAAAERIRENADFHLGQEMARRQLAEKASANLTVDRAAVLREAADVAAQVGRRVFSDAPIERRGEGAWETAAELRRMADEAQQPEEAGR